MELRQQQQQQQLKKQRSRALTQRQLFPAAVRLTALALSALCSTPWLAAAAPLSDWHSGIATNYGGAQDGMNPYDPSFGTQCVRLTASV